MYLDDLHRNFGSGMMMDSRNTANRSNKPIASQLAKGSSSNHKNIRISRSGDSDEEEDDDAILAGGGDLR